MFGTYVDHESSGIPDYEFLKDSRVSSPWTCSSGYISVSELRKSTNSDALSEAKVYLGGGVVPSPLRECLAQGPRMHDYELSTCHLEPYLGSISITMQEGPGRTIQVHSLFHFCVGCNVHTTTSRHTIDR